MPDDAEEIARIAADQRASPADLLPQPDVPPSQPEPDPEPEPPEETPAPEAPPPEPTEAKVKKSPVAHLTGRIGNLAAKLNEETNARQAAEARLQAAEALLNARGTPLPDGTPAPADAPPQVNPATGRTYTQAEFQSAVQQAAARQAFDRQADAVYDVGAGQFTDWKENIDVLNASGIMSKELLDAAMALGDQKTSAAVIHKLGSDLEEAQRIAGMKATPARMGVELAKIAAQVSQPVQQRVSSAPAPIPAIRGGVNPAIDLGRLAEGDDMQAYAAARAKQGDPYALSRRDRALMARNT